MLYLIYEWWNAALQRGADWAETCSFLYILGSTTVRAILGCLIAFIVSLMVGNKVILKLISLKVGQPIRSAEEVHKLNELHHKKAGTPTMGGVMIIGTITLAILLCGRLTNPFVLVTMFVLLGLGALGFMDDYTKVTKKSSDGVSSKFKLVWQGGVALVASLFLYFSPQVNPNEQLDESVLRAKVEQKDNVLHDQKTQGTGVTKGYWMKEDGVDAPMKVSMLTIPLSKKPIFDMSLLAIPFFTLIIIGASNAVNLTDGLDGLATGCTITVGLAYAAIAYLAGHAFLAYEFLSIPFHPQLGELSVFLMALVGASFGFLWFNCHPAKMFMGDTGSLAIGGAIGTVAICTKQELLLVLIGWVFVMEALSVIIQVGSFKTRGKRVFKMAPIHHHFELKGWHENQVIIRFWLLSLICALLGLLSLKIL